MSYKPGDKLVLEIGNVVNVPGYERVYIGKYSAGSFTESSLHNLDRLDSDYINEHYGELQNEAYQQGMDDAWELSRKISMYDKDGGIPVRDLLEIFQEDSVSEIYRNNTARQAKSKIEAWEKSEVEIKVGDIVKHKADGKEFVVTSTEYNSEDEWCTLLSSRGGGNAYERKPHQNRSHYRYRKRAGADWR